MSSNTPKSPISISVCDESFETWITKPYINAELRPSLRKADLLIVPREKIRNLQGPVFPAGTEDLYFFLKEKLPDYHPEICISDEQYQEYAFHGVMLIIGGFIVTVLAAPIFVNVVSEYINKQLALKSEPGKSVDVKFEMSIIESDGTAKKIKYDGPAEQFQQLMEKEVAVSRPKNSKKLPKKK